MIEVYDKNSFVGEQSLQHNGDMTLTPYSCTVSIELGGAIVVEMEHPVDTMGRWRYLQEENVIVVDTPWAKRQAFRIWQVVNNEKTVKISAQHIVFDLKRIVNIWNWDYTGITGDDLAAGILTDTGFSADFTAGTATKKFSAPATNCKSRYDMLLGEEDSLLKLWGCEWLPDNYTIHIPKQLGTDRGVVLRNGINAAGVDFTVNTNDVVTSIFAVTSNGYYNANGVMVKSPKIDQYATQHEAAKSYNVSTQYTPQTFTIIKNKIVTTVKSGDKYKLAYVDQKGAYVGKALLSNPSQFMFSCRYSEEYPFYCIFATPDWSTITPANVPSGTVFPQPRPPFRDGWENRNNISFPNATKKRYIYFNLPRNNGGRDPFKHSLLKKTNNDAKIVGYEGAIEEAQRLAALEFSRDRIDEPQINVSVDYLDLRKDPAYSAFEQLEEISLGDTITVQLKTGLSAKARVIKLGYDCVKHQLTSCEIGSFKRNYWRRVTQRSYKALQGIQQVSREVLTAEQTIDLIDQYTEEDASE